MRQAGLFGLSDQQKRLSDCGDPLENMGRVVDFSAGEGAGLWRRREGWAANTTERRFTNDFKREAVSLRETSGRMQTGIAQETGIMPTMLRRWQRTLQESGGVPTSPASEPPVSTVASPTDQASEIARLRRELDRARIERDILSNATASLRRCRGEFAFIEQTGPSGR